MHMSPVSHNNGLRYPVELFRLERWAFNDINYTIKKAERLSHPGWLEQEREMAILSCKREKRSPSEASSPLAGTIQYLFGSE